MAGGTPALQSGGFKGADRPEQGALPEPRPPPEKKTRRDALKVMGEPCQRGRIDLWRYA